MTPEILGLGRKIGQKKFGVILPKLSDYGGGGGDYGGDYDGNYGGGGDCGGGGGGD